MESWPFPIRSHLQRSLSSSPLAACGNTIWGLPPAGRGVLAIVVVCFGDVLTLALESCKNSPSLEFVRTQELMNG